MATATMNTTSGIVYVRSISGTVSSTGAFTAGDGTTTSGGFTFTAQPTLGFARLSTGVVDVIGGDLRLRAAGAGYSWVNSTQLTAPSNGVLLIRDSAGTDFGRLQFGGTTSSFPALKRSSAALQARLADDSTWAEFDAGILYAASYIATGTTAATSGAFRLPNNTEIVARNAANNADISLIGSTTGNGITIGDGSDNVGITLYAGSSLVRFEGATSSYPALKRNSTNLEVRLADDSGYTYLVASNVQASGGYLYGGGATYLMRNTVSLNNGSGAQTGTLTNSPTAGNPTKWIAIDDNGTARYIPTWS